MEFGRAFQTRFPLRAAWIGAAGDVGALFRMAGKLPSPVLVASTTPFEPGNIHLADHHISVSSAERIEEIIGSLQGVILLTGKLCGNGYEALSHPHLMDLFQYADQNALSVVVEVNTRNLLPPDELNESRPILEACREVIIAARLTPDAVSADAVPQFLMVAADRLKPFPRQISKIALLDGANTERLAAVAAGFAVDLLPAFDQVLIAGQNGLLACYPKMAGVILAAGGSSRFGVPKQLVTWRGIPFVRHAVLRALEAGLSPVVIVVGAVDEPIRAVVHDLPVIIAVNSSWRDGQSTSIHTGLQALDEQCGACIFLLADQPQVTTSLLTALVAEHRATLAPIIAPLVKGQRGNPVLFDRQTFPALMGIQGDQGGRAIFHRFPIHWLEWLDENLLVDIDTPDDLAKLGDEL